jgi:excisionase family DNA binding protein
MAEKNVKHDGLENAVWMNTAEAAAYLRISPGALRNCVHKGSVPYYKFLRSLRFKRTELDRLLESTKRGGFR